MALSAESRSQWQERISQQQRSGLSQQRWCQEPQICLATFTYWKKKLAPPLDRSAFRQLEEVGRGISLRWRGLEIRLESDFDSVTVKRLLEILGQWS